MCSGYMYVVPHVDFCCDEEGVQTSMSIFLDQERVEQNSVSLQFPTELKQFRKNIENILSFQRCNKLFEILATFGEAADLPPLPWLWCGLQPPGPCWPSQALPRIKEEV